MGAALGRALKHCEGRKSNPSRCPAFPLGMQDTSRTVKAASQATSEYPRLSAS